MVTAFFLGGGSNHLNFFFVIFTWLDCEQGKGNSLRRIFYLLMIWKAAVFQSMGQADSGEGHDGMSFYDFGFETHSPLPQGDGVICLYDNSKEKEGQFQTVRILLRNGQ